MRTLYTYAVLLLFTVFQIFAIEPVQFEVISRFPNGRGEGEFRFHEFEGMGSNPSGPKGLSFVDGVYYITDNVNQRVIRLEDNGNRWGILLNELDPGFNLIRQGRFIFDFASSGFYNIYNHDKQSLTIENGRLSTGDASYYMKTVIAGDMILVNTSPEYGSETPQYYGFHITENFDGTITMMNPEETIRYLKEDYEGTEEFTVDEEGYIFWDGKLVAPYGDSFSLYHWKARNPPEVWQRRVSQGLFVGWDTKKNSYWNLGRAIVVIDPEGQLVMEFFGENINAYEKTQFALTPEGTLYVLSYNRDRDEFELMKLERFW